MIGKAFNRLQTSKPMQRQLHLRLHLHLALTLALLFATALDVGHQHDSQVGELQCYSCHFSPDLGLIAVSGELTAAATLRSPLPLALPEGPYAARAALYTARGPPLLS